MAKTNWKLVIFIIISIGFGNIVTDFMQAVFSNVWIGRGMGLLACVLTFWIFHKISPVDMERE